MKFQKPFHINPDNLSEEKRELLLETTKLQDKYNQGDKEELEKLIRRVELRKF